MKKIIPILGIILLLASCSNSKDLEKIGELSLKIGEKDVEIMEMKIENGDLERQISELEEKVKLLESNNKNDSFQKTQECGKYQNSLGKYESLVDLFYSSSLNTCVIGYFYTQDSSQGFDFASIKNAVTGTGIDTYVCEGGNECLGKYRAKIKELKN